jgi:hypothetical protein
MTVLRVMPHSFHRRSVPNGRLEIDRRQPFSGGHDEDYFGRTSFIVLRRFAS